MISRQHNAPLIVLEAAIFAAMVVGWSDKAITEDAAFAVRTNLRAGSAKVDITPQDVREFEVTGHRRKVTGVRDPLRAGVLILSDGETKAAIVTLDTINVWNEPIPTTTRGRASQRIQTGVAN